MDKIVRCSGEISWRNIIPNADPRLILLIRDGSVVFACSSLGMLSLWYLLHSVGSRIPCVPLPAHSYPPFTALGLYTPNSHQMSLMRLVQTNKWRINKAVLQMSSCALGGVAWEQKKLQNNETLWASAVYLSVHRSVNQTTRFPATSRGLLENMDQIVKVSPRGLGHFTSSSQLCFCQVKNNTPHSPLCKESTRLC